MRKLKFLFVFFIITGFAYKSIGQDKLYIDSLLKVLDAAKIDSTRIRIYYELSSGLKFDNYNECITYANKGIALSKKNKDLKNEVKFYNVLGIANSVNGKYETGVENFKKNLELNISLKDELGEANAYNNLASAYYFQSKFSDALMLFLKALKMMEKFHNEEGIANACGNIGNIYRDLDKPALALKYYNMGLALEIKNKDEHNMATSYSNISSVYMTFLKNPTEALFYVKKALELHKKNNSNHEYAISLLEQSNIYFILKDYHGSIASANEAKIIFIAAEDEARLAQAYANIAIALLRQKKIDEAILNAEKAAELSKKTKITQVQIESNLILSECYNLMGRSQKAYEALYAYSSIKDTIFKLESNQQIAEMESKYESEKKQKEIEILNKDNALNQSEIKRQKNLQNSLFGIVALVCLIVIVVLYAYRNSKKASKQLALKNEQIEIKNQSLNQQNEEILTQRDEIESKSHLLSEKNKEVTDSINYARRIQQALLASDSYISKHLENYFVLFKPKDIVAGDFYWMHNFSSLRGTAGPDNSGKQSVFDKQIASGEKNSRNDDRILIAAADCTGHGVPGAFMSMLGINFLNEIVIEKGVSEPGKILDRLRNDIIRTLNPEGSEEESKDGMDITFCAFDLKNLELSFAAANNPLWIVRNENNGLKLLEYKADKFPVGKYGDEVKPFTNQKVKLQKGDTVYLFSDGFPDQFGGPNNKKFKYKQLEDVLTNIYDLTMVQQKQALENLFEEWRGNNEQTDDVMIIGVRV